MLISEKMVKVRLIMNQGIRFRGHGSSVCATNLRARLILLRTNVGKRPIRGRELIDVRGLIKEIRYINKQSLISLY